MANVIAIDKDIWDNLSSSAIMQEKIITLKTGKKSKLNLVQGSGYSLPLQ